MFRFDGKAFLRYLVFTGLLMLMLIWYKNLIYEAQRTFDFDNFRRWSFFIFVIVGALLALISVDVFDKNVWTVTVKLELVPFLLLFFLFGSFYLFLFDFVFELMRFSTVYIETLIMMSQLMFGYILVQFFIKD